MRYKDSQEQRAYLKHAASKGHVELVFAGLDVLGSTPWKINRKVFDVVLKVWNEGGRMCKVPPAAYDVPEPTKPENIDTDINVGYYCGEPNTTFPCQETLLPLCCGSTDLTPRGVSPMVLSPNFYHCAHLHRL